MHFYKFKILKKSSIKFSKKKKKKLFYTNTSMTIKTEFIRMNVFFFFIIAPFKKEKNVPYHPCSIESVIHIFKAPLLMITSSSLRINSTNLLRS